MIQHKELATGRWNEFSFVEQMAHVGSEVSRALNWKSKNNRDYSLKAGERALELLDLTLIDPKNNSHLSELVHAREALLDFFWGENRFSSSEKSWRSYFDAFAFAAQKHR